MAVFMNGYLLATSETSAIQLLMAMKAAKEQSNG